MTFQKAAGIIPQCTRCFSLRAPMEVECPTCRTLFDVRHTETQPLPLGDVSSDAPPMPDFVAMVHGVTFHA